MARAKHIAYVVLTFALLLAFFVASSSALQRRDALPALAVGTPVSLGEVKVEAKVYEANAEDVLWLARCIYSETNQPHEQELVAWVVRNRVETQYRGRTNYRDVVLDPYQFSAFNVGGPKRDYFMTLSPSSRVLGWQRALEIAQEVAHAPADERPFERQTRHFYSERSMVGSKAPAWAKQLNPVKLAQQVDARRFRFYAGIS